MDEDNKNPNWTYMYSEILKQEIAINKSGWVFTKDDCKYSPQECSVLYNENLNILTIHIVKKVFGGGIVNVRSKNTGRKPEESGPGKSRDKNTDNSEAIQGDNTSLPANRNEQLNIF